MEETEREPPAQEVDLPSLHTAPPPPIEIGARYKAGKGALSNLVQAESYNEDDSLDQKEDLEIALMAQPALPSEMRGRLREVQNNVIAVDDEDHDRLKRLVESGRQIVREGIMCKLGQSGTTRMVYVWLFDDVLMYAKMITGTGKYHLQRFVPLNYCQISLPCSTSISSVKGDGVAIEIRQKNRCLALLVKDEEERQHWYHDLLTCKGCRRPDPLFPPQPQKGHKKGTASSGEDPSSRNTVISSSGGDPDLNVAIGREGRVELEEAVVTLKQQVTWLKERLQNERMFSAMLSKEIKREQGLTNSAIANYEVSEASRKKAIEREQSKRHEAERELRKEKDVNTLEMERRLQEMYTIKELQEQLEAHKAENARVTARLHHSFKENEALLHETKSLHQALAASKKIWAGGEVQLKEQLSHMTCVEQELFVLRTRLLEKEHEVGEWKRRYRMMQKDFDQSQILVCQMKKQGKLPCAMAAQGMKRKHHKQQYQTGRPAPCRDNHRPDSWQSDPKNVLLGQGKEMLPPIDGVQPYQSMLTSNKSKKRVEQLKDREGMKAVHHLPPPRISLIEPKEPW